VLQCEFFSQMIDSLVADQTYLSNICFSYETTIHLRSKVKRHNVRVWGSDNPCISLEYIMNSLKINMFCTMTSDKVYSPFFLLNNQWLFTVTYWEFRLMPLLLQHKLDDAFQQDGALLHFHSDVTTFLNNQLPNHWTGWGWPISFPLISPALLPTNILPCSYITNEAFVPCQKL